MKILLGHSATLKKAVALHEIGHGFNSPSVLENGLA